MIEFRDRQIDVINRARLSIASGKRAPIIVAPTGSGKTVCGAGIIKSAESKSRSVLFLAHRFELVSQASLKLAHFGIAHNIVAPAQSVRQIKVEHFKAFNRSYVDHHAGVDVGTVQTKSRRIGASRDKYDLIMPDECHLSISPSYGKVFAESPKAILTGLTATPYRLDGKGLGAHCGGYYDDLVIMCQPQDLIDDGHLVPFRFFISPTPPPNFSDIKIINGDRDQNEVAKRMMKPSIIGDVIDHYSRYAKGRPAMYFCGNIKQAEYYASAFKNAGFKAVAVSGKSSPHERKSAIEGLANGSVEIVFNCMLYIEGLDQPIISCIGLLAYTESLVRFMQSCGRGSRPHELSGKSDCIVFDHVGNSGMFVNDNWIPKHGFPSDDREWSLDGKKKRNKKSAGEPDIKIHRCPRNPVEIYRSPARCAKCDCTGSNREIKQVEGTLVEITPEQRKIMQVQRKREEWQCKTLEDFIELGKARGYQYPRQWAIKRYGFRAKKTIDNVNNHGIIAQ